LSNFFTSWRCYYFR